MSTYTLLHGDCLEVLQTLDPVDAVVTDPPYELAFMGRKWDASGIAFQPDTWAAVMAAMKPGAYLLAFGGSRTYHRMVCAIEDAGFVVRDCLMWLHGQGFPKSHNLDGEWSGYGTALKPAYEPIVLTQKPLDGTYAANVATWGCGALNIDGCRIGVSEDDPNRRNNPSIDRSLDSATWNLLKAQRNPTLQSGRWPANVLLDEVAADALDAMSGERGDHGRITDEYKTDAGLFALSRAKRTSAVRTDQGGASRFFYVAKASRAEREQGLDNYDRRNVNDGRQSSIDNPYQRGDTLRANTHPTVKPVQLMRYLVRLVTPPNGLVLDPFMGSGTTGVACMDERRRFVGIEREAEYIAIAQSRIEAAAAKPYQPELFEVPA